MRTFVDWPVCLALWPVAMVAWLVEHGITSVSANIDAIGKIRETVARTEKRIILESARRSHAE